MNVGPVPRGPATNRPARLGQHATSAPHIHRGPLDAKPLGDLGDADGVAICHEKSVAKVLTVDQGCSDNQYMTQTKEIWFTTTRKGQRRAYYLSRMQFRAFPMPLAEAELLIATGAAVEIPGNPMKP